MSTDPDTKMQDIVIELAARRLYEDTASWFSYPSPTPWGSLNEASKDFFKSRVIVKMPEDDDSVTLVSWASPTEKPSKSGPLRHPMVVWETLILFICSIVIGHLIK